LAPDGKRFAIFPELKAPAEEKRDVHMTFLLNFSDELRRRARPGASSFPQMWNEKSGLLRVLTSKDLSAARTTFLTSLTLQCKVL
jgi:hypothetical protein